MSKNSCEPRFTICVAVLLALNLGLVCAQPTNGTYPIDLPTALQLAGARNLDVQIARERLAEAQANRQSALEQFFPWISAGAAYHRRDGVAQAVPAGTISDAHYQSYSPGAALAAQQQGNGWTVHQHHPDTFHGRGAAG